MFDNNFGKCGFSKFFHQLIRKKIIYVYTTKTSISLAVVATLPCEIENQKSYRIFTTNITIMDMKIGFSKPMISLLLLVNNHTPCQTWTCDVCSQRRL